MNLKTSVSLKPCPFCGGKAYLERWRPDPDDVYSINGGIVSRIFCNCCNCEHGYHESDDIAVQQWNRRVINEDIQC